MQAEQTAPARGSAVVVGGGVAGCAAATLLARAGVDVTLVESEAGSRNKVCGEFLSGEALEDLHALGVDVASLGAVRIDHVRLAAAGPAASASLPFPAASVTRRQLDRALLETAEAAGVRLLLGRAVQKLDSQQTTGMWTATLEDGSSLNAPSIFLATGKHDLRGHGRPRDTQRWVAFKMYYRLGEQQAAAIHDSSELMVYAGGYCGLQPVEDGIANLCCVVQHRHFRKAGGRWQDLLDSMQRQSPHLALRLQGAEPVLAKPLAIAHIPYGFLRTNTEPGLFCIGDQASCIPSFTGDGISVALFSARFAAQAFLNGVDARHFQPQLRRLLLRQMRMAELAAACMIHPLGRMVLPGCLRLWPGAMRLTATLTRVARSPAVATVA